MNTIILKLFLISAIFPSAILSYAQSNYRPGFIISLQNDTIYGQIDFRTDKMNAKRCVFKPEGDPDIVTYYPSDKTVNIILARGKNRTRLQSRDATEQQGSTIEYNPLDWETNTGCVRTPIIIKHLWSIIS